MERRISALILAGGYSSRMGRNKAELMLGDRSFLEWQVERLRALGIEDIVIAGTARTVEGACSVPDRYPHRGPLSGIHAGLDAIRNPCALVLAVDTPLVPAEHLEALLERHESGVTVTTLDGELEPLIGVYDRSLCGLCENLLRGSNTSLRKLFRKTKLTTLAYTGDPALLLNCNTPEDYAALCALALHDPASHQQSLSQTEPRHQH